MKTRRWRCVDCSEWFVVATKAGPLPKRCEACKAEQQKAYKRDYHDRTYIPKPKPKAHVLVLCQCCGSALDKDRVEAGDPYCRRPSCEKSRLVVEELKAERAAREAAGEDLRGMERPVGPEARPDLFNQIGPKHGETWDTDR